MRNCDNCLGYCDSFDVSQYCIENNHRLWEPKEEVK
jgi:hypothetical protein